MKMEKIQAAYFRNQWILGNIFLEYSGWKPYHAESTQLMCNIFYLLISIIFHFILISKFVLLFLII